METTILTYVYYKWETLHGKPIGPDPELYMKSLHELVKRGYFDHVTYAGQLNTFMNGVDVYGPHYSIIIEANKEETRKMLDMIDYDISESFVKDTMEKLNGKLETFEEVMERTSQIERMY